MSTDATTIKVGICRTLPTCSQGGSEAFGQSAGYNLTGTSLEYSLKFVCTLGKSTGSQQYPIKCILQMFECFIFTFSNLSAYTGRKVKDYADIDDVYSVLYIENLYNFTLPNWTRSIYPGKMRTPACFRYVYTYLYNNGDE